ncbi:cell division protein PerM [Nocardia goodfellowii]
MSSSRNSLERWTGGSRGARSGSARGPRSTKTRKPDTGDDGAFLALTPERGRALLLVSARPAALTLTAMTVLVLATLLTARSGLAGTAGAIAASWLAAHQVPLVIGTTELGLLPLLPTALVLWLTWRETARAVEPDSSRADLGWLVGAAVGGPLLVTAVCSAVAEDASGVVALQPPNTLAAFGWVLVLQLLAAGGGIASRLGPQLVSRLELPEWVIAAGYAARRTVLRLLAAGAALTLLAFLLHWSRIGDTYQGAGNAVGVLGLTALSLAYLPNVVLGAVGVSVGAGAHFGAASIGLFSVTGGPIPAVPVLAALPSGPAATWWLVFLLIPAALGALNGLDCGRTSPDQATAPWATLTSAALTSMALTLLAALGGGVLGSFGRVGLNLPLFGLLVFGWLAIAGYAGLMFTRWFVVPVGTVPRLGGVTAPAEAAGDYDDHSYYDEHGDYEEHAYDDEHDYHDDEHGYYDEHDGSYHEDEYEADYPDYDGPDLEVEVDGELVEEEAGISIASESASAATAPDIVDAEVVDTPDTDPDPMPRPYFRSR